MKVKVLLLMSLFPIFTYATTLSYLYSDITPISCNQKGEVLCKTRFAGNMSGGGYAYDFVRYGFCVLAEDSVYYFKGVTLGMVDDHADQKYSFWDDIYSKPPSIDQLNTIVSEVLKNEFEFSELNAEIFKVDTLMKKDAFEKKHGVNLNEKRQKALFNALSKKNSCAEKIQVDYDFGNIILLYNYEFLADDEEDKAGCFVSYYFNDCESWGGWCFDLYGVSGVLFKEK